MELWGFDYLDLEVPAFTTLDRAAMSTPTPVQGGPPGPRWMHGVAIITAEQYNSRMSPRALGEAERLILFALVALPADECYGVPIRALIEERTGRSIAAGAVYTALDRLAARGFVSSRLGEPSALRGGRPKRLYRLEAAGARELARSHQALTAMSAGLMPRLELHVAGASRARKGRRP